LAFGSAIAPKIRIWVRKFEAGTFDDDAQAADLLQRYEAKIAALERMVGRQALEIELLMGALKRPLRLRSASTSVITGPVAMVGHEAVVHRPLKCCFRRPKRRLRFGLLERTELL